MTAATDAGISRLQRLTIRARVSALQRIARRALRELDPSHPGLPCARRALDLVVAWLHDAAVDGPALQEALLDANEHGVFALVDPRNPQRADAVFELVGGVVSLAAWHAFRAAGGPAPEGYEEDEEILLRWLLEVVAITAPAARRRSVSPNSGAAPPAHRNPGSPARSPGS